MEKKEISSKYKSIKELYSRLGQNIVDALKTFMDDQDIPFLDIYFRVKKFDSFLEKIERKSYKDPFEEIEDILGVRVICYYSSDIEKINEIITKEFEIIENQNKTELLGLKEFAYRSHHFIVKINKDWETAPNYRNLGNLKAEVQVRTILMHAWAEIEHKLNYKSDAQVPDKFQRKLFRLSAKFEEADEQFEELRTGIDEYKNILSSKILKTKKFDLNQDFNLNTFIAYIKFKFPEEAWTTENYSVSFESFKNIENAFEMIDAAIEEIKPHFKQIEKDLIKNSYDMTSLPRTLFLLWFAVGVINLDRYNLIIEQEDSPWKKVIMLWRRKIKAGNNV